MQVAYKGKGLFPKEINTKTEIFHFHCNNCEMYDLYQLRNSLEPI